MTVRVYNVCNRSSATPALLAVQCGLSLTVTVTEKCGINCN